MTKRWALLSLCMLTMLCTVLQPSYADDGIRFICNPSLKNDSFKKKEIREIFLGLKTKNDIDQNINIVLLPETNDIHKSFIKKYIRKTSSQFRHCWRRMLFTGQSGLPIRKNTSEKIMEHVASTPNAIGYIDYNVTIIDNIKIINIQ